MNPETLSTLMQSSLPAALAFAFSVGFVLSFNPVALGAIPVSLAFVTRSRDRGEAWLFATCFIVGLVLAHLALGLAAGAAGSGLAALMGRSWGYVLGPLLIVLGLVWMRWIRLPKIAPHVRVNRPRSMAGALALGVPFAVAVCPVCSPALAVLLGVAAGTSSTLAGGALLLAFGLGRAVPVAIGAYAVGWLEHLQVLTRYQRAFEIAGGLLLIAAGAYMLNAVLFIVPSIAWWQP
jgi:cytochrome c-type biogenesis protein